MKVFFRNSPADGLFKPLRIHPWSLSHPPALQRLFTELTYGERFGRVVIEQIFVKTIGQLVSLYTDSPEVRYQAFLDEYPTLSARITQYHIASYVGVKPQSLSRIRARWAGKDYTRLSSPE
jgi:CRP-like cAMP-binding protein